MHSLKTSCAGQILALAKPHDSVGKRTRNRIPKEERKTLVESFIKKHQKLNNGSFPSLSLTHKEVGGSFYTIREIVREIIHENRVLGPGDSVLEGTGKDQMQDQSMSSSILMDPVPPLSLSPDGFHPTSDQNYSFSSEAGKTNSPENGKIINGSQASSGDRESDISNCKEVNGNQLFKDVRLPVHQTTDSSDISNTQFAASNSEENYAMHNTGQQNIVQTVCDSVATLDEELNVDSNVVEEIAYMVSNGTNSVNNDEKVNDALDEELNVDSNVVEEIAFMEFDGTKSVNIDKKVNDDGEALTEMVNITKDTLGTTHLLAESLAETFPLRPKTSKMNSLDAQPSELDNVGEGGKGAETEVKADSSTISHDLGEISSSTSAVLEEKGTEEVIVSQIPNHIPVRKEKQVGETIVNLASRDVECADTQGTVDVNTVIDKIHETKEFSNGTLTTEQKIPRSGTESGTCKNDRAKVETMSSHVWNEVARIEKKATMEKGKLDTSDSDDSSSQKEINATLNRIKPESWKGEYNKGRQETNPLLAALKYFVTAFVKFWSE